MPCSAPTSPAVSGGWGTSLDLTHMGVVGRASVEGLSLLRRTINLGFRV